MSTNTLSTTETESKDQTVICNLISQRDRFLSLLNPLSRYTPVSPYPNYTKAQLDMRRKVEILQYKKNSTQVYQTTKKQKWSQLANATTPRYVICNKNPYVTSPSSACDVPGPPIYLSYDPTVPLYNYATNQNAFSIYTNTPLIEWDFVLNQDISGGNMLAAMEDVNEPKEGEEGYEIIEYEATPELLVGTLVIQNIETQQTTYSFTIPVGLFANGKTIGSPMDILETIQITKADLKIYYYSTGTTTTTPSPLITIPITNSFTNTNIFDLSMSFLPTITDGGFQCSQYIGDIIIPNIQLSTFYGFLYDFKLYFELSYQQMSNTSIDESSINFGVYVNMPPYDMSANGCILTPQTPSLLSKYLPFSFVKA